ncbi:MAG TPA: helix-turn-helix domain-containing protein [Streptosporangiaceae bacterium]|nr:helix-turn-helix domain-containing protein [Streptosporangiaceae bacterium]
MSLDDTGSGTPGAAAPAAPPELRKITDARTLRALAHPVRIAILEALSLGGAMTATEVGEQIGESSTTCSFHLRQLAKYGFVEEAGGGKGRARPWRMTTHGMEITNTHDDPDTEIAIDALVSLIRERQLDRYRTWRETRATYPRRWRDAAEDADLVFHLTAEELKQLSEDLLALLRSRFPERNTDPSLRPPGSVPVEMLVLAYPLTLPPADGDDREVTS